jgi:putative ABC transport system substrate-binding protein
MRRRDFIKLIAGSAAVWPFAAYAQKAALSVIGLLSAEWPDAFEDRLKSFRAGLREVGYVEGQNVRIEYRWGEGQIDRLPALAAELVRNQANVIVALGSTPAAKRLELVHELLPKATVVAALVNPANPLVAEASERDVLAATCTLGLDLHILRVRTEREIDEAFGTLGRVRADALLIDPDALFISHSKQLAALATRYTTPAIHSARDFAVAGGLMSYGNSPAESYRQAGVYAGRVLKGEKPSDLPVHQATKVTLVINLKAAKTLGLNVPNTLIGRADEVIE